MDITINLWWVIIGIAFVLTPRALRLILKVDGPDPWGEMALAMLTGIVWLIMICGALGWFVWRAAQ